MCRVCNPMCPNPCWPKPIVRLPVQCPICGIYNPPDNKKCKKCGIDMRGNEIVEPQGNLVLCLYTNTMCDNPCARYNRVNNKAEKAACVRNKQTDSQQNK